MQQQRTERPRKKLAWVGYRAPRCTWPREIRKRHLRLAIESRMNEQPEPPRAA